MLQYRDMKENSLEDPELKALPKGTIVRRNIRGTERFYHQWRENGVTKSRYLNPGEILPLRAQLARRQYLQALAGRRDKGPIPADFRCDVLTGRFLAEYAAAAKFPQKREAFADLAHFIQTAEGSVPADCLGEMPRFIVGGYGTGKTTLLRQLIQALPPTRRAKAAYIRLTGTEAPADVTADLARLRDLGFRLAFIDDAQFLSGLPGTGLTCVLAGESVPRALSRHVVTVNIAFIPFREFTRLTGEADPTALVERGGILGSAPAGPREDLRKNDRFVLDVLAWAALRAKDDPRLAGESFLGTDLQKLRTRFAGLSACAGEEDDAARRALLDVPLCRRFAHARARIAGLLQDPTLGRLGAAERRIIRDLLMDEVRTRLLEDAVWNELRHARWGKSPSQVNRVPFAPGAYGFVIADDEELACEVVVLTTDALRTAAHLRYIDDPARLDVLEHRFGTITGRTVLYNGRDARLASGIVYRNLAKYLAHLAAPSA